MNLEEPVRPFRVCANVSVGGGIEISMLRLSLRPKMTLGISPAVSSCTDPFMTAICWFLVLSSRHRAPAHRIQSSLLLFAYA
jgi:hypothetical protein